MSTTPLRHALLARQEQTGSNREGGSNSLSSIISTLVPVLIISTIIFIAFLFLRPKVSRVYRPRTLHSVFPEERKRTPEETGKTFGLFKNFKRLPDSFVLHHNSLDGYLFLRFFKLLIFICVAGCLITWPVLFPVNATGGGGQSQLDIISFSNVQNPIRYYAHAFVGWVYLGFVMLAIAHERMFFVGVRQAYFLADIRARRLTSRTVLFMNVPKNVLSEQALRELLGASVRRVWMVNDCKKLDESVQDREKAATKLEAAEVKLITNAQKETIKDGSKEGQAKMYLEKQKTPTHKLKFLIGKKVKTIDWARDEIPKMNQSIKQQQDHKLDNRDVVSAAFVEFSSQYAAQRALQFAAKSKKDMKPRYIDVQPQEIIWKNMSKSYATKKIMMALATAAVVLMTIFWSPITLFVGALTNINYLTNLVPFLSFINSIPSVILGVVTGLLPVVILAVLLILVPIICRLLAKTAGAITLSEVEHKTQSWYFVFQVIQVFLITTFASGASAVTTQIINNPGSAPTLLAENLPKASNFYISYFILFGLMQAALQLLMIVPLLMKTVLGRILDKTPRKQYNRWTSLSGLGWGSEFPKWTNLGVIALSYAMIAPLILGFASIGLSLLYIAFRHNWLFVFGNQIDMKGEAYARALKQLTTGVYLSTVCLIGLFAIGTSDSNAGIGPLVVMVVFLVVIAIFHALLDRALAPLEQYLPLDMLENNPASMNGDHAEEIPKENMLTKRIRPIIHSRFYSVLIRAYPVTEPGVKVDEDIEDPAIAYLNPAIVTPDPLIWLPRDNVGVSRELIRGNQEHGVRSTDDYAWFDEKGKVVWDTSRAEQVEDLVGRWRRLEAQANNSGRKDFATGGGQGVGNTGSAPGTAI